MPSPFIGFILGGWRIFEFEPDSGPVVPVAAVLECRSVYADAHRNVDELRRAVGIVKMHSGEGRQSRKGMFQFGDRHVLRAPESERLERFIVFVDIKPELHEALNVRCRDLFGRDTADPQHVMRAIGGPSRIAVLTEDCQGFD